MKRIEYHVVAGLQDMLTYEAVIKRKSYTFCNEILNKIGPFESFSSLAFITLYVI